MQDHQPDDSTRVRAAQYVRMSTEHQKYSIANQSAIIARYAEANHMRVVRTYSDEGRSGVTLQHRKGLRTLLMDVEGGAPGFSAILVYDVSRWGRFQDADESAYYEYRCKRAKIQVHYCAEPFPNDGSISSTLWKAIKRAMAAEYSRELGRKVFAGKCRLIELGYRQGGHAGFGLRRLLLEPGGVHKGVLRYGERKSIITDRVILIPGPESEIEVIRNIYTSLVERHRSPGEIARELNRRDISSEHGRAWTRAMIKDVLTNPKYVGTNLFNRRSYKLGAYMRNPPEMWVRKEAAFTPIIDPALFQNAQDVLARRRHHYSDAELLELLKRLLAAHGRLSAPLIDACWNMPSHTVYAERFGGLLGAYERIGYTPEDDYSYISINEALAEIRSQEIDLLTDTLRQAGAGVFCPGDGGQLVVNGFLTLRLDVIRCRHTKHRGYRWFVRTSCRPEEDVIVAARMAPDNTHVLDYYLFPKIVELPVLLDLSEDNHAGLDVHRFETTTVLVDLIRTASIEEVV